MQKTTELQQPIKSNETLIENNIQLTKINSDAFELINESIKKQKELLTHCGKIYKFLQSKTNKTWEEKESIDVLYDLITHTNKTVD